MTISQTVAGWYPDPNNAAQLRWYDGRQWTEAVHAAPVTAPQQATYQQPTYQQPAYQAPVAYGTGFGTQYGAQPQYGAQQQQAMPANGCQICGASPALAVHLRGHQGMLLLMRFLTYKGRFCRDCGTAKFREVQRQTMMVGWWGYASSVINLFTVLWNTNVSRKIAALGQPQGRVAAAKPAVESVFKSPGFVITLCVPLLVFYLLSRVYG